MEKLEKCMKKFNVQLAFDGLSNNPKIHHFYFKHITLTCDITCFKLEMDV